MEIAAYCPLTVGTLVWERQPGEWNLTAIVKATFSLRHGQEAVLAPRQEPPTDDVYWENNAAGSLYAGSDYAPFKPRADVMLVGQARSPGAVPAESVTVRLRAGEMRKALRVTGDRIWQVTREGLRPSAPRPFVEMPLRYELGSLAGESLVGAYPAPSPNRPLANLEVLEEGAAWGGRSTVRTPGVGPLSPAWRARRLRLGEDVMRWVYAMRSAPGMPPPGLDFAFFNAAPTDQQLDAIRPGMVIALENLTRSGPVVETRLPSLWPRVVYEPSPGQRIDVAMRADTLWIDTDRELAVVTFRGIVPVKGRDERVLGRLVVSIDPGAREAPAAPVEVPPAAPVTATPAAGARLDPRAVEEATTLFTRSLVVDRAAMTGKGRALESEPPRPKPQRPDLSFAGADEPSRSRGSAWGEEDTGHHQRSRLLRGASAPPAAAPAPAPADEASVDELDLEDFDDDPPTPAPREAPRAEDPPVPAMVAPPSEPAAVPLVEGRQHTMLLDASALVGSLSSLLAPAELTFERWAESSAELATGATDDAEVLGRFGLSPEAWQAAEARFRASLATEAAELGVTLLRVHDSAWLAAVERGRGPVDLDTYARLLVAHERGQATAALEGLRIPAAALLPIERAWRRRAESDRATAERVERAVEEIRSATPG